MVHAEGMIGVTLEKHLAVHEVPVEINKQKQHRNDLIAQFSAVGDAMASDAMASDAMASFVEHQPVINYALPLTD